MRSEISSRLYSTITRCKHVPRRISWTCSPCHLRNLQPGIPALPSARSITTASRINNSSLSPALQGLIDEDPNPRSQPVPPPKQRPLNATERRAIQRLDILLEDSQAILQKDIVPTEGEILEALKICRGLADYFKAIKDTPALTTIRPEGEAGNLLFLDQPASDTSTRNASSPMAIGNMASTIADSARSMIAAAVNNIAEDKKVFMTPKVLSQVVEILSSLEHPESLAQIFVLYAEKPIPMSGSMPVEYKPTNPSKISGAISLDVAQIALEAGLKAQNLPLCLDITEHTVSTKAYKRSKIARKALVPAIAAAMTPLAAYVVASRLAEMQDAMSTSMMTIVGTAGIMTYMGVVGTMGFITIATANDQMDRVTWAPGIHMRQRWLREDERAFMDKIACAWGFQDRNRRGEEEGPVWESLKELCGVRGMILDRVELMDGMQ